MAKNIIANKTAKSILLDTTASAANAARGMFNNIAPSYALAA